MLSLPQQEEDLDVLSETETAPALVPTVNMCKNPFKDTGPAFCRPDINVYMYILIV